MSEHKSRFLIKQRALLKGYLITMAKQNKLYGLQYKEEIKKELDRYGYKPTHSEIYKSLHELMEDGTLKQIKRKKEGAKLQTVMIYLIEDKGKAELYMKQLKVELDRCYGLLGKAIADFYS